MAKIGVSKPYYGIYQNNGGTVTYTGGGIFAKAVEFSAAIESGDTSALYADNGIVESDKSFAGGTLNVTTDDIGEAVAVAALGLTVTPISIGGVSGYSKLVYDDDMEAPHIGFGIIIKKKVGGVYKYRAVFLHKVQFNVPEDAATTQGETIEWQTPEIEGVIMRDDSEKHPWKSEVTVSTEAIAEAFLKEMLGITAKSAAVTSSVVSGTYDATQSVVLSTTESAGLIYYTDDGTIPSAANGMEYTAPISLTAPENICIKAVCVADGKLNSDILELYIVVEE